MNTLDTILLITLTTLLSILILMGIAIAAVCLKLLSSVRQVVTKAESVVDSVESAADVLKDAKGRLALFKLIRNIIKIVGRSR